MTTETTPEYRARRLPRSGSTARIIIYARRPSVNAKIWHVTGDPGSAWTRPTRQFIDYVVQVANLLSLTERGIRHVIRFPDVIDALAMDDTFNEAEYEPKIDDAKAMAKLAESEIKNDFPLLRSHTLMGLWGALEAMVEDLAVAWIQYDLSILDDLRFAKIKVPLVEYQKMDQQEQISFLVSEVQRDLRSELKGGVNQFESLLNVVGLGGSVDRRVREVIFEVQNLRNAFAHRAGIADRKFVTNCPHLNYSAGDKIKISRDYLNDVLAGFLTYSFIIYNRCATIDGSGQFDFEPEGFEGALAVSGREDS
jgi:hypothetical protein